MSVQVEQAAAASPMGGAGGPSAASALPADPPMPFYIPTRNGLDLGPPIYLFGSRTTHCDIHCTTNTIKPSGAVEAPVLISNDQHHCVLPYEVAKLLHMVEPHLSSSSRTPLELQQETNFRLRKNRVFKRERRAFLRRLALARHDRYMLESMACVRIQAAYRGYVARLHLQAWQLGLTEEELEVRRALRRKRREEARGQRHKMTRDEAEKALFAQAVEDIRSASIILGLPPIDGYTLPCLSPPRSVSARRNRGRRGEYENSAATMVNKMVRGYLARKEVARMSKDRLSKHDYDLCVRVQSRWRGFRVRRDCWKLIQSKFYGAAVSIQSSFRGYRARKHVDKLRRLVNIQKRQALAAKRIQNRVKGYVIKRATDEYGNTAEGTHTMKRIQSMPPTSPLSPTSRPLSGRKFQSSLGIASEMALTSGGALVKAGKQEEPPAQDEDEEVVSILGSTDNITDAISGPPAS